MIRRAIEQPAISEVFTGVERTVPEFLELDLQANPDYLLEVWARIIRDERFSELGHAALVHATNRFPGTETAAIAGYDGFLEGVRFATEIIRQSIDSVHADREMMRQLDERTSGSEAA